MGARLERTRVYVADDHPLYREGVVRAIKERPEFELVGSTGDGAREPPMTGDPVRSDGRAMSLTGQLALRCAATLGGLLPGNHRSHWATSPGS